MSMMQQKFLALCGCGFHSRESVFLALDEREYVLPSGLLVIADDKDVLALAGVMGGRRSGCDIDTQAVWLECAHFSPLMVAASGRSLQLESESRYRFERGVDGMGCQDVSARAADMIVSLAGGTFEGTTQLGAYEPQKTVIGFESHWAMRQGGIDITPERVTSILESLGFQKQDDGWCVPSWRFDIHVWQDPCRRGFTCAWL